MAPRVRQLAAARPTTAHVRLAIRAITVRATMHASSTRVVMGARVRQAAPSTFARALLATVALIVRRLMRATMARV